MAKISKSTVLGIVALVCAMLGLAPSAMAAAATVPQSLTQQGRLLDDAGMPVKNPVTFTFSLYTAASGGTAIWFEQIPVTPDDGYFSARLGETKQFDATIFDGSRAVLFLGIKVGNDAEMTPRQQITSVPFALLAGRSLTAALADEATHAANADLAKNATNAANAANATLAANATNAGHATNADHATVSDTVTSIAGNFVVKDSALATTPVAIACDAGTVIVGGFCQTADSIQTTGLTSSSSSTDIHSKTYHCAPNTAGAVVTASIVCAK